MSNHTSSPVGTNARPTEWEDFIGQATMKEQLSVLVNAALATGRALEHILLYARPGYGKTTLAELLAGQLADPFDSFLMPISEDTFLEFLDGRGQMGGLVYLDELHRAPLAFQYRLLTAIEDRCWQGPYGDRVRVKGTIIGGTSELGGVIKPLQDRFLVQPHFEDYTDEDIFQVTMGMAQRCGVELTEAVARGLARAAGGVPRAVETLVAAALPLAIVGQELTVSAVLAQAGLDCDGLSRRQLAYLQDLKACGGTAGLKNLANMTGMQESVLEEMEPPLVRLGLVVRTPQGRKLTTTGRAKLHGPNETGTGPYRRRP